MSTYNSRRLDRIEESLNRLDAPGVPNPITGDLFSKEDVERAMAELAEEPNCPRVLGIPHDRFATMLESEIARLEAKLEEPTDAAAAHDSRT